ncbi:MAG TPA: hypothetical protein VIM49_01735 [Dermatophilaceae bacterium]
MRPVGLDVDGVVDQVDPGGGHAEGDDREEHLQESPWLGDDAGGDRCGEDQDVLDPLAGAARPKQTRQRRG